jgi:hypothetical protein
MRLELALQFNVFLETSKTANNNVRINLSCTTRHLYCAVTAANRTLESIE